MNNFENLLNHIKYPLLTEKAVNLYNNRQYTFIVSRELTKMQIKFIIEKIFTVKITAINTCILPIKNRRVGRFLGKKTSYKKAYITLEKGNSIAELLQ
jgi:large subunit ribosomal protein L23